MKPRISMITLAVRDLAVSIAFYQQGLGFPRMESPPGVAFFTLNGSWLGLYGREALAAGATQVKPAQKVFWGGYSGYFNDPDGHLWEVAYNPLFWVGPEDERN